MRITLNALVAALVIGLPLVASAAMEDAAYSRQGDKPVRDSQGACVRTKWLDKADPCAIAKPAEPVRRVAAPVPVPPPARIPNVALEQRTIYFAFDSAKISSEEAAKLDKLAAVVNGASGVSDVVIHGFTDQFGSESYNQKLAEKRAEAVRDYLNTRTPHVNVATGDIRGLGKAKPEESCLRIKKRTARIACMKAERRVELELKAQE